MAITWFEDSYDHVAQKRTEFRQVEVTHVGRVVKLLPPREIRIMSDVWADEFSCVVATDDGGFETVRYGDNSGLCSRYGRVEVDASDDLKAIHLDMERELQYERERNERAAAEIRAQKYAEAAHNTPVKGKTMTVVGGRKAPKGTTGKVFYVNGSRVGLALSDDKDAKGWHKEVAWVDARWLVNAVPMQTA